MTKQLINLGAAVDDSTGDYLRQGGSKINENFNEAFDQLGDGAALHPAGAWKTWGVANGQTLTPDFGKQYNLNTLGGSLAITLPKGSPAEYGRVIKLVMYMHRGALTVSPSSPHQAIRWVVRPTR